MRHSRPAPGWGLFESEDNSMIEHEAYPPPAYRLLEEDEVIGPGCLWGAEGGYWSEVFKGYHGMTVAEFRRVWGSYAVAGPTN